MVKRPLCKDDFVLIPNEHDHETDHNFYKRLHSDEKLVKKTYLYLLLEACTRIDQQHSNPPLLISKKSKSNFSEEESADENLKPYKYPQCAEEGCNTIPSFNYKGESKAKYCKKHKQEDMICIRMKCCEMENCKKQPSYDFPDSQSFGKYCGEHKLHGMVNVRAVKCKEENCNKQPSFNFPGKAKLYCNDHKKEGMVNVVSRKCQAANCSKFPIFNYPAEKYGAYCGAHRLDGMVDIHNKNSQCRDEHCCKQASFNFESSKKAIYCQEHKLSGMVDVRNKKHIAVDTCSPCIIST